MIFKVFYQADKTRSPRRETTQILYLDLDVKDEKEGIIAGREVIAKNTDYIVEFIDALSDEALEYERENTDVTITTF
ncbi:RNA polymerase epsilon subunit [Lactococcus nasutitermitis]|uniref:DNA-directed RNA polymerase subunit epsilon n=1 Tax=Lactococcus nasutitermitis TaxID=1652957 RepID=A0ABV9JF73_9LACT|nr:RNA polymerase epsilon subunit [Lactococcus nasutitermitis]